MPELSNLPIKTKYTPEDRVFIFDLTLLKILSVTISEWRVEVDNPLNDSTGRQIIFYKFEEVPYELQENLVFASENSVLAWMKNDFINRAIESGSGGQVFFGSGLNAAGDDRSWGNWTDFAGLNLMNSQFIITGEKVKIPGTATISGVNVIGTGTSFLTHYAPGDLFDLTGGTEPYEIDSIIVSVIDDTHMTLSSAPGVFTDQFPMKLADPYEIPLLMESEGEKTLVFDYCFLLNATLPESINTKSEFRDNVRSYDAETTIWTDGLPIGRP